MATELYCQTANRACSLLYSYLKKSDTKGFWLIPVNVCPVVPLTFCLARIPFEFVDIDPQTLCLDLNKTLSKIESSPSKYDGMIFVRSYGYLYNTSVEFSIIKAASVGFKIIDDRCLCIPERSPDLFNSDMVLYSTGHCKQIDLGSGGIAFYSSFFQYKIDEYLQYNNVDIESIYKKAFQSGQPLNEVPEGWLKMETLFPNEDYFYMIEKRKNKRLSQRALLNNIYNSNLPNNIKFPVEFQEWRFNIKVPAEKKEIILKNLFKNNLFASCHYHSANKLFDNGVYTNSDNLFDQVINLFNDDYYTEDQAFMTCNIINQILN